MTTDTSRDETNSSEMSSEEKELMDLPLQLTTAEDIQIRESHFEGLNSQRAKDIEAFDESNVEITDKSSLPDKFRVSRAKPPLLLEPEHLVVQPGLNPRLPSKEWDEHIDWLEGQMLQFGFREDKPIYGMPSTTEDGKPCVIILDGESRYRAACRVVARPNAPFKKIPVMLCKEGQSLEELTLDIAASNTGRPFTPIEQAMLVKRMLRHGRSHQEIAKVLKCSLAYVKQLTIISRAPGRIHDYIREGKISVQTAQQALRGSMVQGIKAIDEAVKKAESAGVKRVTAKNLPKNQLDRATRHFAPSLFDLLKKLRSETGYFDMLDDPIREEIDKVLTEVDKMATESPEEKKRKKEEEKAAKKARGRGKKRADDPPADADGADSQPSNDGQGQASGEESASAQAETVAVPKATKRKKAKAPEAPTEAAKPVSRTTLAVKRKTAETKLKDAIAASQDSTGSDERVVVKDEFAQDHMD